MAKLMFRGKEYPVTQSYNGKDGCACGCNGTYTDHDGPAMTRRVNKVLSFVGPMRPDAHDKRDAASYSTKPYGDECHVYVREGERITCVYVRAPKGL